MGCSSSCQIFERFSTGLHNVGQMFMPNGMMFIILDDFLILAPTFDMCKRYYVSNVLIPFIASAMFV
jgi:hypothetical protein